MIKKLTVFTRKFKREKSLLDVGAEISHSWGKENVNEHFVVLSVKTLKMIQEIYILYVDSVFFQYNLETNLCIGGVLVLEDKRKLRWAIQIQGSIIFFIPKGLFMLIECLKVWSLISSITRRLWQYNNTFLNRWQEEELKFGRMAYGFFTKMISWHTICLLPNHFYEILHDPHVGTHTIWLSFIFKDHVCVKKKSFCVHGCSETKAMDELTKKLSEQN